MRSDQADTNGRPSAMWRPRLVIRPLADGPGEIATSPLPIVTAKNYSDSILRRRARLTFPSARAWNFHVWPGSRPCTSSTACPIPRPVASKSLKQILVVRNGERLTLVNVPTTLLRPGVTSRSTRNESTRMRSFKGSLAKAADEANPKPSSNTGTAKRSFIWDFEHGTEARRLAHELSSVRYRWREWMFPVLRRIVLLQGPPDDQAQRLWRQL